MSLKRLVAGASALATLAAAGQALAQNAATTSASATAIVSQPIAVSKVSDLVFGRVIRPSSGATTVYTISETSGATSTSGGDGIFTTGAGAPGRAVFTVSGEGGQAFNISTDPTVTTGGVTINLTKSSATATLSGTVGSLGTATFGVGGNVTLTDASPTGSKTGSFNVTVTYQ